MWCNSHVVLICFRLIFVKEEFFSLMTTPFSYKRQIVPSRVDCSKSVYVPRCMNFKIKISVFEIYWLWSMWDLLSKLITHSTFLRVQVLKYMQYQVGHFKLMVSMVTYLIRRRFLRIIFFFQLQNIFCGINYSMLQALLCRFSVVQSIP